MSANLYDVSIVIPFYNEQTHLPGLLADIQQQKDIRCQIILVDGGSSDNSSAIVQPFWSQHSDDVLWCCSIEPHRAKQLNLGAAVASSAEFLFLHADSRFCRDRQVSRLLANALFCLNQQRMVAKSGTIAGHFPLLFDHPADLHPAGFYFYAAKTALNRIDTINGDQGFLLSRAWFETLGGFDESLPYMEDARLAGKIFQQGNWITLPGCLQTSARRFITEGFYRRQMLNAFLSGFEAIGYTAFLQAARDAYRLQDQTGLLDLRPFLRLIHRLLYQGGIGVCLKRWYSIGAYVASNAWQLAFSLDCQSARRHGLQPHRIRITRLSRYDRYLAYTMQTAPIKVATALLTFVWFYSLFIVYRK